MRKITAFIIILPIFLPAFHLTDILPEITDKKLTLKYRVYIDDSQKYDYGFTLNLEPEKGGAILTLTSKNGKLLMAKIDKRGNPRLMYLDNKTEIPIKSNVLSGLEKVGESDGVIEIKGKKYNTHIEAYKGNSIHSIEKGNLKLITNIDTEKRVYKERDTNIIVKIEIIKHIEQTTINILKPDQVILKRKSTITEIVQLEE